MIGKFKKNSKCWTVGSSEHLIGKTSDVVEELGGSMPDGEWQKNSYVFWTVGSSEELVGKTSDVAEELGGRMPNGA